MKKRAKIISLLLVIAMFAVLALGSNSSSDDEVSKVGEVDGSGETSDSTEDSDQTEFKVGDVLTASGIKITYMASGVFTGYNQYLPPADGNKIIFLKFYIENTSDSDKSISYFDFDCYADGYDCEAYYDTDTALSATLSAGRTTTGCVYFEVPENASDIEVEYEVNIISEKKVKFIYEGEKDSGFTPTANTSATEDAYKPGDIIESTNLKITYVSCGEYTSSNQFVTPADGCKFIKFDFEFENIGTSDVSVSSLSFKCFADGASCDQSYSLDDSLSATLSAGRKTSGSVIFEVPTSATVIEAEYETNYWTSGHVTFSYVA